MKILTIGNSFSQDATRYLREVSNDTLFVRNLCIGGCSLETHAKNIAEGNAFYSYEIDAQSIAIKSINEVLTLEKWDYITIQQVSHFSGIEWTYEPFIAYVLDYIKAACPDAKIAFHRTWSYDPSSDHGGFPYYNRNTNLMYEKIVEASDKITKKYNLPIIDNGTAIQRARELDYFNVEKGGISINRDGFHLSLDYGRYLAALTMYEFFTGKSKKTVTFAPEGTDPQIIEALKNL